MRFIKLGFISFIVISGIILAISAMIPSEVKIIRSINLPISKNEAIAIVSNLEDWKNWNVFVNETQLKNLSITENEIKSDILNIKKIDFRNDSLITIWSHKNQNSLEGGFIFYGEDDVELSVVQWYFTIKVKWYPWEKFGSAVYEKQIGPELDRSLERLDAIVRKK